MDKPFVILKQEMKDDITDAVNKHINVIPADDIADFLEKLTINFRSLAAQQLEEARKQLSESKESKTE